jgi:hypothetical protein
MIRCSTTRRLSFEKKINWTAITTCGPPPVFSPLLFWHRLTHFQRPTLFYCVTHCASESGLLLTHINAVPTTHLSHHTHTLSPRSIETTKLPYHWYQHIHNLSCSNDAVSSCFGAFLEFGIWVCPPCSCHKPD